MKNETLITFWKLLNFEHLKGDGGLDSIEAHETAKEASYEPIDTRYCIIRGDFGATLLIASGSKIIDAIEGGDL